MIDKLSGDPSLCLATLVLLLLWLAARIGPRKFQIFPGLDGEKAADTLLRVVCGFLLVGASLDKLGNAAKFSEAVGNYQVLAPALVPLAGVVIPWLEFFAGIGLALGVKRRGAAFLFCALMLVYAFSLSWALAHGIELNCSCFDSDSKEAATWLTVLRDVLFLAMGFIVWTSPKTYAALGDD